MRISLLHATYRAGGAALAVRAEWIEAAADSRRLEYIFACDEDDDISIACEPIASGVVGVAMPGRVSAVRNWNAAAAKATGDLLLVVSDDLFPPIGWDQILVSLCCDLDPRRTAFVINVNDHDGAGGHLIRHPVLSRRYYERFGLWHHEYDGYVADYDFTYSAHRRNLVIDGSRLSLEHRHPSRDERSPSDSHDAMPFSLPVGREVFARRWPVWKRRLIRWELRPRPGQLTIRLPSRLIRAFVARLGYPLGLVPRRMLHFLKVALRRTRR